VYSCAWASLLLITFPSCQGIQTIKYWLIYPDFIEKNRKDLLEDLSLFWKALYVIGVRARPALLNFVPETMILNSLFSKIQSMDISRLLK